MKSRFAQKGCAALILLLFPMFVLGQATGFVFHDANSNGSKDAGEPGIADALVSNGSDVTKTDSAGRYLLPVTDDVPIFLIKPRNWMTPVNADGIPRYYYLHKPQGSPELKYPGVAPTGPLPSQINFPLTPSEESDKFSILVFGDPQPYSVEQVDFVANDIVKEVLDVEDIAFGLTLGDIVGDDLDLYEPLTQVIGKIGVPWYYVYGNHDTNYDGDIDTLTDETYERFYGPATYAFTYGRVHFIVFDDVIYYPGIEGLNYIGGLREDQFLFIENYLKFVPENDLVVMSMHIPIEKERTTFRHEDRDRLFRLFARHPKTLSLSAHSHMQRHDFFDRSHGWLHDTPHHHYNVGTTSGSWWQGMRDERDIPHTTMRDGTPNGYAFIHFDGTDYVNDWKAAGRAVDYQMNIYTDREISQSADSTQLRLLVNFFNGNERARLEYRLDGGPTWKTMERTLEADPYYLKLDDRWKTLRKMDVIRLWKEARIDEISPGAFPGVPLPRPVPSEHLWVAPLPKNLDEGTHRIDVRATDMYGRSFLDYHTFRVVRAQADPGEPE